MPNMFGGDQFNEDYAPTALVNHMFFGFENTESFSFHGKSYHFSINQKNILVEVAGSATDFDGLAKVVKARILSRQTWGEPALKRFVDNFVLTLDGQRLRFNKENYLPEKFLLKQEMSRPVAGPLYQVRGKRIAPAFVDKEGGPVWIELKHARNIARTAGLKVEVS